MSTGVTSIRYRAVDLVRFKNIARYFALIGLMSCHGADEPALPRYNG